MRGLDPRISCVGSFINHCVCGILQEILFAPTISMSSKHPESGLLDLGSASETGELSELDALLAAAEEAAEEAQRTANAGEIAAVISTKHEKEDMVARAEGLQREIAGYSPDDDGVEDYYYEEIFRYAEQVTGVATPEDINTLLAEMRKAGEGLRRFAQIQNKSFALQEAVRKLKVKHDNLFQQVQEIVVSSLEDLKRTWKGEANEFEARYQVLLHSPLVKGIEVADVHSPQERREVLKQEIMETCFRPIVDTRLVPLQHGIEHLNKRLNELRAKRESQLRYNPHLPEVENTHEGSVILKRIKDIEQVIARNTLALTVNQQIVDKVMAEARDESELEEASLWLKKVLDNYRTKARSGERYSWGYDKPNSQRSHTDVTLGEKILGMCHAFGVSLPGERVYMHTRDVDQQTCEMSITDQLIGVKYPHYPEDRYGSVQATEHLRRKGVLAYYQMMKDGVDTTDDALRRAATGNTDATFDEIDLVKIHPELASFMNLGLAYKKVDAGYQKEANRDGESVLPHKLAKNGWKMSVLGAFVPPDENPRRVDFDYSRTLEDLSQPQVEADRLFDVRTPDGAFRVYTFEQATDLLRRARRDARAILDETERALMGEKASFATRDAELTRTKATLNESERAKSTMAERVRQEIDELNAQHRQTIEAKDRTIDMARQQARENYHAASQATQAQRRAESERDEALRRNDEFRIKTCGRLEAALQRKVGMFSADKELRTEIQAIINALKAGTQE